MSFFEEMAELVLELLDVDDPDSFGELISFERPIGGYDPVTRKKVTGQPKRQQLAGTLKTKLSDVALPNTLIAKFDGVIIAAPDTSSLGFAPGVGDMVTIDTGSVSYKVAETAHVVKRGIPIAWICGVNTA